MKILVFGGSGQLGHELTTRCKDLNFEIVAPVTSEVNICDFKQVDFLIKKLSPDVVINSAAYTAVDQAEEERDLAFATNKEGVENIAKSIAGHNKSITNSSAKSGSDASQSFLISLSTDYVFNGNANSPYKEEDVCDPVNVYGESKLAGEQALLEILPENGLVVRTSSLHGAHGDNFVHTMIKLFQERQNLTVVNDQFITLTWAGWLAETLLDLARLKPTGIIHAAASGVTTWYDFAQEILSKCQAENQSISKSFELEAVSMNDFKRPAPRPKYSALDCSKLAELTGVSPIGWKEGLERHLLEINYER